MMMISLFVGLVVSVSHTSISTDTTAGESCNTSSSSSLSSFRRYHNSCSPCALVYYHPSTTATTAGVLLLMRCIIFCICCFVLPHIVFLNISIMSQEPLLFLLVLCTSVPPLPSFVVLLYFIYYSTYVVPIFANDVDS